MKKKKNTAMQWITGMVLAFLCVFCIINIGLAGQPVMKLIKGQSTFAEFTKEIREEYTSDDFYLKNLFININGLFARITGQTVCNEVVLMDNGMLTEAETKRDMKKQAEAIEELAEYVAGKNIPFLYVQAPYKEDPESRLLPEGVVSYANENMNELLQYLEEKELNVLNLAPYFNETEELIETYYFRTDHHWTYEGAFVAFQKISEKIATLFPEREYNLTATELDRWERHTLENWFLGSRGKRVGNWFAGTDDFTWFTPLFETEMSCAIPKHRQLHSGDFVEANMRTKYLEEKNYFEDNTYVTYLGGDYPLVQHRNNMSASDVKILFIKDSYAIPVQVFLSTVFKEVDVVDPRHLTECTVAEYVARTRPDLVVLMQNPSTLGTSAYVDFGVEEALTQGEKMEFPMWQEDIFVEASDSNNYHYKAVPVAYGKTYTVTFDDVEFLQGEADGVVTSLYNRTTKTILCSGVYDLKFCRDKDCFEWTFSTPASGADDLVLIFYAGLPGNTKNISVEYNNVAVYEWD